MVVHVVPTLASQRVELFDWRILRTAAGSCHFVGCRTTHGRGRVSSAIKLFNPTGQFGLTRSDTLYVLEGPSSFSLAAQAVWLQWCAKNEVESWVDVTDKWISKTVAEDHASSPNPDANVK